MTTPRGFGPFLHDESLVFEWANAGKRSIVADLKSAQGRQLIERLLVRSDVVVQSFRPGVMERLGFGEDRIRSSHPTSSSATSAPSAPTARALPRPATTPSCRPSPG